MGEKRTHKKMTPKQKNYREVISFYDQQWGKQKAREEYSLFTRFFHSALLFSYGLLGNLSRKKILEIGAGSGEQALFFAEQGAEVTAIDLSEESVQHLAFLKEKFSHLLLQGKVMDAQCLDFPPETFDLVYINSVLMHVDLQKVFLECARVLKPEGKLVLVEPQEGGPLVKSARFFSSYRSMQPAYVTIKRLEKQQHLFQNFQHREFYFSSFLLLPLYTLISQDRYLRPLCALMERMDSFFLQLFPSLCSWCWVTVAKYEKP